MIRIYALLLLFILQPAFHGLGQEKVERQIPAMYCISNVEYKLYNMINAYRQRYDLPPIPLSKSLSFVASTHVKDLFLHHPDQGSCNQHSWSDQGTWKPFCYPRDENKKNSVWDKPKEITSYKGKGYEISYFENTGVIIDSVMVLWKSIDYFNNFLMNTGKWQGKKWNAIGIGIYENYACAWFGELADTEGPPQICGQETAAPVVPVPEKKVVPVEKKSPSSTKDKTVKVVPAPEKTTVVPAQVQPAQTISGGERYYIIVKGIAPEKELQSFLKDLQKKGYSSARIVERNGKQRVSIQDFSEKATADSALRQVKKIWQDAWILKQ